MRPEDKIAARSPDECSDAEFSAFVTLAAKGEEVEREDIERGVRRAAALLWIDSDTGPVAVAAVKRPFDSYRRRLFRKAGLAAECGNFSLELGYLFVEETHRGNEYGSALLQKAVKLHGGEPIYATTRSDNKRMQEILRENGFVRLGSDYPSKRDASRHLRVFGRPASKSSKLTVAIRKRDG